MTEIAFREAPFKTTNGTTARSLDDWFGDVINVREFESLKIGGSGTMGDHTGNDAPCFQAAFDLAFGSAAAPHGNTNKHLNRPVFIPAGWYRITDTLTLTQIVGGYIYGAGTGAVQIDYEGAYEDTALLDINGAANLCIERMSMNHRGNGGVVAGTGCMTINLDWTDTDTASGSDGLHHNYFSALSIGAGDYGIRIAASDNQGHNNLFVNCTVSQGAFNNYSGVLC